MPPALLLAYSIVDTLREPLLVLDHNFRVAIANRAFYSTFQVSATETENCLIYELGNGQWDIPQLKQLLEEILPQDQKFEDFEVEHDFPQIGRKTMLLNARRLDDGGPFNAHILLAIEDITARKEAQKAVDLYIKKLEWSNRELQDFAYIASHDLQEPLRAIQAFGERLKVKNGDNLTEEGQDYLERMQAAAGRMRVLIHDLLAFSRVTTKAKPFSAVDLTQMTRLAVTDLHNSLQEVEGTVEIGELPILEADATQMRQLMQNLIGNALKFHREDELPAVKVSCQILAEDVQIVVEDNGIGFDQKYAARIFTPFQRLHSQRKYAGTGIGLAICRKIVERHHGTISVESVLGQGTRFIVVLPKKQPLES